MSLTGPSGFHHNPRSRTTSKERQELGTLENLAVDGASLWIDEVHLEDMTIILKVFFKNRSFADSAVVGLSVCRSEPAGSTP